MIDAAWLLWLGCSIGGVCPPAISAPPPVDRYADLGEPIEDHQDDAVFVAPIEEPTR